jgi:hypothetical protein
VQWKGKAHIVHHVNTPSILKGIVLTGIRQVGSSGSTYLPKFGRYYLIYHGPGTRPRKVYFQDEPCIHPDLIYERIICRRDRNNLMCKVTTRLRDIMCRQSPWFPN